MSQLGISTIGEAHDLSWRIRVYCRWGKRDAMKSIRECHASVDLHLATLIWTRGRSFEIADLGSRMKCIRCGSRRVSILVEPPLESDRQRASA